VTSILKIESIWRLLMAKKKVEEVSEMWNNRSDFWENWRVRNQMKIRFL